MSTYVAVVPYADQAFADAYALDAKVPSEVAAWNALLPVPKIVLLKTATQMIDLLPLSGTRNEPIDDQPRAFPRNGDTEIPYEVQLCTCEIAFSLAAGKTLERMLKSAGLASESIGDASKSYEHGGAGYLLELNYGMVSAMAARYLSAYLHDYDVIELDRVG